MYYAQAESLKDDSRQPEPMGFYRLNRDGEPVRVGLDPNRALWRNSDSLFALTEAGGLGRERRPLQFKQAAHLRKRGVLKGRDLWRCSLFGLANERAKPICWAHEDLPVPPKLLDNKELVDLLRAGLEKSESVGSCLRKSIECLAYNLIKPAEPRKFKPQLSKKQRDDATRIRNSLAGTPDGAPPDAPRYWAALELPFKQFLRDLPADGEEATRRWVKRAKREAVATLSEAARHALRPGHRELRARVAAEGYLKSQLSEITLESEGGDA